MATAIPQKYEHLERWAFGDTEQQADEVVQLILNGTKTATCSNPTAKDPAGRRPVPGGGR